MVVQNAVSVIGHFVYKGDYMSETIEIKYHSDHIKRLENLELVGNGDWIDLRSAETVTLEKGEFRLVSLGVSMKLPDGYEAHILPRSSTLKSFGILQGNHMGVVDNSYSGNGDVWFYPALAIKETTINENDRICQFRIMRKQGEINFVEVEDLGGKDRGGFGSTGKT